MTRDELFRALEPLTLEYKETNIPPLDRITEVAVRWMDEGDYDSEYVTKAFEIWDDVMAELVQKHNITKRNLQ